MAVTQPVRSEVVEESAEAATLKERSDFKKFLKFQEMMKNP